MGIESGGQPLGPKFPRQIVRKSATAGFRRPAPYDPRLGHNLPLPSVPETLRVSVNFLTDDESGFLYECYKVDKDGVLTNETENVYLLTDPESPVELESGTLALAHLIDGSYWMETEDAVVATVDFIVDNFDRADADELGSLWSNTGRFGIRNGRAYSAGSASYAFTSNIHQISPFAQATYNVVPVNSTITGPTTNIADDVIAFGLYQVMSQSGPTNNLLYQSKLSSGDTNYRIVFNASAHASRPSGNIFGSVQFCTHVPVSNQTRGTRFSVGSSILPHLHVNGSDAYVSVLLSSGDFFEASASCAGTDLDPNNFLRVGMSVNDNSASRFVILQDTNFVQQGLDDTTVVGPGSLTLTARARNDKYYSSTINSGIQNGLNTLYMEVRSGLAWCWLNGTLLFSGEPMYTLSAGMFGLTAYYADLSNYQAGITDFFLQQVKVWSSSIPEPPDSQSGHGTYDPEDGFHYTDKYHQHDVYNPNA